MKKIYLALLILTFFFISFFFFKKGNCVNNKAKIYSLNNNNYCLLTANNQEQWRKGLMFYKKPVDFDGMIFIFPSKQIQSFWNENTYLDLDLYWMDGETVVGKSSLPSIKNNKEVVIVGSKVKVNRVVELIK